MFNLMTTSEDEGDGENDEDATVETNTERCPGQSRLHRAQKNKRGTFRITSVSKHLSLDTFSIQYIYS